MADNTEILREMAKAFNEEGVEPTMRFLHPEFELVVPPDGALEPGTFRGRDGIRRYWDAFYEVMDEIRMVPDNLEPIGDAVVVDLTMNARGKSTGIETELKAFQVYWFEDGLLRRVDNYPDRDAAMAAARAAEAASG